jgi:hypothetical protein
MNCRSLRKSREAFRRAIGLLPGEHPGDQGPSGEELNRRHLERSKIMDGKGVTRCNRTACQNELYMVKRWWNSSTRAWYCQSCAFRINETSPDLCVREDLMVPAGGEKS